MDRTQQRAIYRSVARRFLAWADGDPHADRFWAWLHRPEQHELMHAFMAAGHRDAAEADMRTFCDVLTDE